MPYPKVKLSDDSGNTVDVTESNELKVKLSDSVTVTATDLSVQLDHANDSVQLWGNESAAGSGTARALLTDDGGRLQIDVITAPSTAVTGTFWQTTQPISIASAAAVDGSIVTLGAKTDDKNAATNTTSITAMSVLKQISASVQEVDSGQLAAGHTIDCNASYVKLKAEEGTALTDGTNSGKLDVTIHSDDGSAFTDSAGKMNIQIGGDSSGGVEVVQDTPADLTATVTQASAARTVTGTVGHDITGGADGVKTVTSAGTDVVLGLSVSVKKVDIQAQTDNTGLIAVGFTGVDATEATGTGIILRAGDTYSLEISNLNLIYIDSTVSGEGVRYAYFT